ncbi:MAG TPA: sigma-70 family RNA polymerase sigma factor [Anaeromyxobacteraceae bacterium]|nr:sigma-70 family RNA polymerase sigma factor [Anaeromyxobacteraceae bacterium]
MQELVASRREFLAFLERRVKDRALAEDILQEAFARGIEKLAALRKNESAVAWFYRVLRNSVIDHARRRSTRDRRLEAMAADLEGEARTGAEARGAVCRCVGRLASTLKPEYAQALRRIEIDGVAVKDYAAEAGISDSNAGVRVFRARQALRKQVAASCGACADHGCLDCTCTASNAAGEDPG